MFLFLLGVVFFVIVLYLKKVYTRFDKNGVNYITPIPLLGNLGEVTRIQCHIAETYQKLYHLFPNDRFVGVYEFTTPVVLVRDLELIKTVTIKDFEHFQDHRFIIYDTVDVLFGRSLFSLNGQEWKDMRSTLSPAFTSAKIRNMVPFMLDVNKQMISYLQETIQQSSDNYIDMDCKDLVSRYANDVIATCAFGMKVNSHRHKDNDFFKVGNNAGGFGLRRMAVYFGYNSIPYLLKIFKVKLFDDTIKNFFKDIVLGTMKERESKNIFRPDMIHLLMEANKGNLKNEEKDILDAGFASVEESEIGKRTVNKIWSDEDLVAQAFIFFVAGFETVSTAMSFLLHELALHPEVQERLLEEIRETDKRNQGKIDYKVIQGMVYMDMVVSEVLRLWPPVVGLDRLCIKDFNLGKPHKMADQDYIVRKGDLLVIPVWALHHHPDYFPDPYKFNPERFSEENKHRIKSGTYMPFGIGPRNCIGSRFALCEVKVMIYHLLKQLEVSPSARTPCPGVLSKEGFTIELEGGHWVRLRLRK